MKLIIDIPEEIYHRKKKDTYCVGDVTTINDAIKQATIIPDPKEINIICVGDLRYRFNIDTIQVWDFDYSDEILRIDFKDGSFVEFYKRNIIAVEMNKEKIC